MTARDPQIDGFGPTYFTTNPERNLWPWGNSNVGDSDVGHTDVGHSVVGLSDVGGADVGDDDVGLQYSSPT